MNIKAKEIIWDDGAHQTWSEVDYGFNIYHDEDSDQFVAAWGEGDEESFNTLDDAKEWCQNHIDSWIAKYAVVEGSL